MGLKNNFFFSSISGTIQYIVLLVTMPYVTRVLGVSNYGLISFVENAINLFIIIATMGINILGVREISNNRYNITTRSSSFLSLMSLNILWLVLIIIIYLLAVITTPQLYSKGSLFIIGISKLISSIFLLDWFYKGLENFKYITTRNISIRIIYIISIFIFIRKPEDYVLFFILTITTTILNSLINSIYALKFITFKDTKIEIKKHITPFFVLGFSIVLSSMYTTFNIVYLGFVSNNTEVGYYTVSMKLYIIILAIFSAFTSVMLPRMSYLLFNNNIADFNRLIEKSMSLILSFTIPTVVFCIAYARHIISIFAGEDFSGGILPMQIIMPAIIMVGIAQVIAYQAFVPLKKDNLVLYASLIGAFAGVILNLILVNRFQSIGSAITLLVSEITVTIFYIIQAKKNSVKIFGLSTSKNIINNILIYILVSFSTFISFKNSFISLTFGLIIFCLVFLIRNIYFSKDNTIKNLIFSLLQMPKN